VRLFIAATFPDSVLREVDERVVRAKPKLPHASWVRSESQHLTFAFLGEQDGSLVDCVAREVEPRVRTIARFQAVVQGCGFFPNSRNARVGWMGVTPADAFVSLAGSVRDAVVSCEVALDAADFKPHMTLCRIRDRWPPASIELFQRTFGTFESEPFPVDAITLFESQLKPTGAVHTALCEFALA
jgi:RNA 2',3'-cyclic 3'-phosphodiesterase